MKKILKIFLALTFAFLTFFINPVNISAEDISYVNSRLIYVDENNISHQYFDIYGNRLPIEFVQNLKSHKRYTNSISKIVKYPFTNKVLVRSYTTVLGKKEKVTQDFKGPVSLNYCTSITFNSSLSVNFGAEINSLIFKTLSANIGVTYTNSSSNSTSIGATYDIPSGKTGAVYFLPYFYSGDCIYVNDSGNGYPVNAKFPKTINGGFTDGIYELELY